MDDSSSAVLIILGIVFFGLPLLYQLTISLIEALEQYNKKIREAKDVLKSKQEIIDMQNAKERELLNIQSKNIQIQKEINKIINDNTQDCPWLAERIADYFEMLDTKEENYLKHKKRPAITASEIVKELKKDKKELLKNNKILQYQLTFLKSTFPMLEDELQLAVSEVKEAINYINENDDKRDDYEILSNYISPDEYKNLSTIDKYQLALDRYLAKKKSKYQIGIAYERYIGYIYENAGYKVVFNGALNGLADLGRDIIAENNKEILIIQCKNWGKEKVIRENTVCQLYGTMMLQKLETKKNVKGVLVTTTILSEEARKIAKALNIQVRESEKFDKLYPCIKCNINKSTKEKIYHLPFDQQYDKIQINVNQGERYVSKIKEAEDLGFRRAKRHLYNRYSSGG